MGKILHTAFPSLIKRIEKSDRTRISVECFDGKSANRIVSSRVSLEKFNLEAFIPNFPVSREGIIRNIPLDISVEDVIRFSSTNLKCPILDARRFIHKNEKGEKIPSTTVQIKLEGKEVPEFIDLFHMRIRVDPYITQPKVCFSCFRFGHVANQCKNPRCRFCGSSLHEEGHLCPQTKGSHTCFNCKGPHLVSDKNCPAFKNQSTIRKIAAYRNIPIQEASQLFYQEKKRSEPENIPFKPNFLFNKYNLNRVDWKIFKNTLLDIHKYDNLPRLSNPVEILDSYHKFVQDIDDALHKADPRIDRTPLRGGLFPSSPHGGIRSVTGL